MDIFVLYIVGYSASEFTKCKIKVYVYEVYVLSLACGLERQFFG